MKALFGFLGIAIAAVACLAMVRTAHESTDVRPFLGVPLGQIQSWEVTAGATAQSVLVDTGGTTHAADSLYIANDSATCVRVGGSDVTTSTGASIGDGCRDGSGISLDAKQAWVRSADGSSITVDVVAGQR